MYELQIEQTTLINQGVFSSAMTDEFPLILIAQESKEDRPIIKELLGLYNARILETTSGEETVDFTVIYRPDLIFIDTALQGLDAFGTTRLIRSICAFSGIPIIFLSDYPERTERYKAFASGGNDYLIKPLDLDRIDDVLERFCFEK